MWYRTPKTLSTITSAIKSFEKYFHRPLVPLAATAKEDDILRAADQLYRYPHPVLMHNGTPLDTDPIFTYGNAKALEIFRYTPEQLLSTPSRLSALAGGDRQDRDRLMRGVAENGCFEGYEGIRVRSDGTKFTMYDGFIWNILNEGGKVVGQAATFERWEDI